MNTQTERTVRVRPPRLSKERKRELEAPRKQMNFKPDHDVRAYVDRESRVEGWTATTVVNDMLTTQMDLEVALGEQWWEVEARAMRGHVSKGRVLADLVLAGLRAEKKR